MFIAGKDGRAVSYCYSYTFYVDHVYFLLKMRFSEVSTNLDQRRTSIILMIEKTVN